MLAGAQQGLGHEHPVLLVLDGVDGRAGGDPAQHGQFAGVVGRRRGAGPCGLDDLGLERATGAGARRGLLGKPDDFKGAGPVRQAPQETAFLQRRDQSVDAGLRGEVQGLLHLVERGRHPRLLDPLVDEHKQFMLLAREHWFGLGTNLERLQMFSMRSSLMSS